MFKKTTQQPDSGQASVSVPTGNSEANSTQMQSILDGVMRFTGAQTLDELEELVLNADSLAQSEAAAEEEAIFQALQEIRSQYSLFEAKEMEQNEDFIAAVTAGFPAEKAYQLAKCDRLIQEAYAEGEENGKKIASLSQSRIREVGTAPAGGYKAEIDPYNMSMEDLKKIKKRLKNGETIRF